MADETTDVQNQERSLRSPGWDRQVEFRDIAPEVAITLGYMMYLAETAEGYTKQWALSTVERILPPLQSINPQSASGIYTSKILGAAIGLARGICSRKKLLNSKMIAAEDKRRDGIARFAKTLKSWGWLTAAVRLILLGGFGYAFVMAVFGMSAIQNRTSGVSAQFASIATALAFALVGSYISASLNTLRVVNIFKEYDTAISKADAEYRLGVESQYKYAAGEASAAWQALTGSGEVPMSAGFRELLMGVVTGGQVSLQLQEQKHHVPFLTKLRCLWNGNIDGLMGRSSKVQGPAPKEEA